MRETYVEIPTRPELESQTAWAIRNLIFLREPSMFSSRVPKLFPENFELTLFVFTQAKDHYDLDDTGS